MRMKINVRKVSKWMKVSILMSILFVIQFEANGFPLLNVPSNGNEVHQWVDQHFAKGKVPPFSFLSTEEKAPIILSRTGNSVPKK